MSKSEEQIRTLATETFDMIQRRLLDETTTPNRIEDIIRECLTTAYRKIDDEIDKLKLFRKLSLALHPDKLPADFRAYLKTNVGDGVLQNALNRLKDENYTTNALSSTPSAAAYLAYMKYENQMKLNRHHRSFFSKILKGNTDSTAKDNKSTSWHSFFSSSSKTTAKEEPSICELVLYTP